MNHKFFYIVASILLLYACQPSTNGTNDTTKTEKNMLNNPLLSEWTTEFGVPPFDEIKNEHYLPAIQQGIDDQVKEVTAIANNKEKPNYKNTIEALELSGSTLKKVKSVFFAVNAAHTNDVLKEVNKTSAPELAKHNDNISLNKQLFKRIASVYKDKSNLNLSNEEMKLLDDTYKKFIRAGVNVEGKDEERLRDINIRIASLTQKHGENQLSETNDFEIHITDKKDLGNLSESLVAAAAEEAITRGHKDGWSITIQRPSINPFLQSSPNRELREKLYQAYALRGDNDNNHDNKAIIEELVNLRLEKANLLGFKSYAEYSLSNTMAQTPEAVFELMDNLWKPALEMAKKDRDDLAAIMKKDGISEPFRGSDWRYYVEKIRKEKFNFDEEETRPYFEFTAVMQGAFNLANKLFGFNFIEKDDLPKWHEDQMIYEVVENDGNHVGVLYMDFFTRSSKRGGAWMNEIRSQSNVDGMITPIVTNNFNYPPATKSGPSLLSFGEAQTLFHEFGHALHGLLSDVKYSSLSGTNVPRDFVEFPSQVMENWMSEPAVLKTYAKHYKTGEVIPDELIKRMNEANNFNIGFATVEYMAAAYLDMSWHSITSKETSGARAFEKDAMKKLGLINEILPRYRSGYFGHIFAGGYAAGYYSYLWSEVLDADTFEEFKKTGNIFDQDLSKKYRKMLSYGGSKSGKELYEELIGRQPKIDALIKKKGF